MTERAIELVLIFTSVFFIVDPFAVIPTFLAMTARDAPQQRRVLARMRPCLAKKPALSFSKMSTVANLVLDQPTRPTGSGVRPVPGGEPARRLRSRERGAT